MAIHDLFSPLETLGRVGYLNLNEAALRCGFAPTTVDEKRVFINECKAKYGLDTIYGGWLERRDFLLQHTYLGREGRGAFHLGVDIWVPALADVLCPWSGVEVLAAHVDPDMDGGWGGRVVLRGVTNQHDYAILVIGHLDAIEVAAGNRIGRGTRIGIVGEPGANGGWLPHVHVQAVDPTLWQTNHGGSVGWLLAHDGYGHPADVDHMARMFPDPLPLI